MLCGVYGFTFTRFEEGVSVVMEISARLGLVVQSAR